MKRSSALVEYTSSSDASEAEHELPKSEPPAKRRKLPSLSHVITGPAHIDNPALHDGRIRTTPHIEGQFAAYVYVAVRLAENSPLVAFLCNTMKRSKEIACTLHSIPKDLDGEGAELHISLSRPIYLRSHQREELKQAVRRIAKSHSMFYASFATFSELQNDEKTRAFLTLEVGAGHNELKAMSEALIPILKTIRQKEFYSEPRFHASIGWALMSPISDHPTSSCTKETPEETSLSEDMFTTEIQFPTIEKLPEALVPTLQEEFGRTLLRPSVGVFEVDSLCIRIGKDVSRWKLSSS